MVRIGFGFFALGVVAFLAGYESPGVVLGAVGGAIVTTVRLYGQRRPRKDDDER